MNTDLGNGKGYLYIAQGQFIKRVIANTESNKDNNVFASAYIMEPNASFMLLADEKAPVKPFMLPEDCTDVKTDLLTLAQNWLTPS